MESKVSLIVKIIKKQNQSKGKYQLSLFCIIIGMFQTSLLILLTKWLGDVMKYKGILNFSFLNCFLIYPATGQKVLVLPFSAIFLYSS